MQVKNIFRYVLSAVFKGVKNGDQFSKEVKLNFKGKESFKTFGGGVSSLILIGIMIVYSIILLMNVANHKNSTKTVTTIYKDLHNDKTKYKPYDDGFQIAVSLMNLEYKSVEYDEQIVQLSFKQEYSYRDSTNRTNYITSRTELGFHSGSNEILGLNEFSRPGEPYSYTYGPNSTDLILQGDMISNEISFASISLTKCTENCKSDEEIETFINNTIVTILLLDHYVDFEDLKNPIKYVINNMNAYYIAPSITQYSQIYIQQDIAEFQDSAIHFNDLRTHKFWTFSFKQDSSTDITNDILFETYLTQYSSLKHYSRVGYSMLDVIANIGGIYGIFEITIRLLVGVVNKNTLLFELIKNLYYYKKDMSEYKDNPAKPMGIKVRLAGTVLPKIFHKENRKEETFKDDGSNI